MKLVLDCGHQKNVLTCDCFYRTMKQNCCILSSIYNNISNPMGCPQSRFTLLISEWLIMRSENQLKPSDSFVPKIYSRLLTVTTLALIWDFSFRDFHGDFIIELFLSDCRIMRPWNELPSFRFLFNLSTNSWHACNDTWLHNMIEIEAYLWF